MAKDLLGVNMHDAGISAKEAGTAPVSLEEQKKRKDYPSMYLRNEQIPEGAKKFNVGDKVILVAVCRVKGKEEEKREKQPDRLTMNLEVEELGFRAKPKSPRDMTTEELKSSVKDGTAPKYRSDEED
jgi:hypothetical protein